jgi:histidinol phosphatase-like PHP family hydrolase
MKITSDWHIHSRNSCDEASMEINIGAILMNPTYPEHFKKQYLEYLSELKSQGVKLCIGSDCHSPEYDIDFDNTASMLESVGIRNEDLWVLSGKE